MDTLYTRSLSMIDLKVIILSPVLHCAVMCCVAVATSITHISFVPISMTHDVCMLFSVIIPRIDSSDPCM